MLASGGFFMENPRKASVRDGFSFGHPIYFAIGGHFGQNSFGHPVYFASRGLRVQPPDARAFGEHRQPFAGDTVGQLFAEEETC